MPPWSNAPSEYATDNEVNMLAGLHLSLYSLSKMWSSKWKMLSPKFQIVELIESMKYSWIAYTWRDHFVSKIIDVDSGVATHWAAWAAAPGPDQTCGAPGHDDQPYVRPREFLASGSTQTYLAMPLIVDSLFLILFTCVLHYHY